ASLAMYVCHERRTAVFDVSRMIFLPTIIARFTRSDFGGAGERTPPARFACSQPSPSVVLPSSRSTPITRCTCSPVSLPLRSARHRFSPDFGSGANDRRVTCRLLRVPRVCDLTGRWAPIRRTEYLSLSPNVPGPSRSCWHLLPVLRKSCHYGQTNRTARDSWVHRPDQLLPVRDSSTGAAPAFHSSRTSTRCEVALTRSNAAS